MAKEFVLPDIGEGLVEAEIVRWHVSVGDEVADDQVLVEVETAKAVVELPSPFSGTVLKLAAAEGETVAVGEALVVIGDPDELGSVPIQTPSADEARAAAVAAPVARIADATGAASLKAMPVIRKLAREHGIDLASVTASGPGGRITRDDIEAVIATTAVPPATAPQPASTTGDDERVPLSRVRRAIGEHMTRSWTEIPHVTVFDRVDGTRLLEARAALARRLDRRVPLESFIVRAVVPVLREYPEFNARLDGTDLVMRSRCNVAVAVDTPDGLIVPVVHDADALGIVELCDRIDHLSTAVRERTATPAELSGGTFTISNIGAIGGGFGTPIIPHGTTAILAVGRAVSSPIVAADGTIRAAPLIPLSLSYDHRVIDGGHGQRFFARLMENLTEPTLFMA